MRHIGLVVAGAMILSVGSASAQDTQPTLISTYYRCAQGTEREADQVMREVYGPIVQKHIDAGHFTGQAWQAHVYGGGWRRVLSLIGTDLDAMMDARAQIVAEFSQQHADAAARLNAACSSRDDYIWTGIATGDGGTPPATPAPASMSAYHACDMSRQGRANQIFREVLAPLYQKHMDMGHITGWGYFAHRVGGRFRSLETLRGADHKTLMKMQGAVYQEAATSNALEMNEFRQICSWHQDYLWRTPVQQ